MRWHPDVKGGELSYASHSLKGEPRRSLRQPHPPIKEPTLREMSEVQSAVKFQQILSLTGDNPRGSPRQPPASIPSIGEIIINKWEWEETSA